METKIIKIDQDNLDHKLMQEAGDLIAAGELVAFPTETVYGLGGDALDPEASKKIYSAKGRPSDNPLIVHISDFSDLERIAKTVPEDARKLSDAFWPGPLTMVVPAKPEVPRVTTGGLDTVAVRMPSDPVASALITEAGVPIAAPSANLSGRPSPTSARHVCDDLDGRIDAIIGGADCQVGIESTVVDMTGSLPVVLRPGIITQEQLSVALGKPVGIDPALLIKPETNRGEGLLETAEEFKPKSPGMKYKHYAPKAEMIIYKGDREKTAMAMAEEKLRRVENGQKVEVIMYDDAEPEKAAREFFAKLRACDKAGVDVILAAALKEDGVGFAVMNRMFKSAGYNIIEV